MSRRPVHDSKTESEVWTRAALRIHGSTPSRLSERRYAPRTREDVEERYVVARDTWTAAMKAANSGKTADLAALAMAQEAYEAAAAECQRWDSGLRVAIPIEPEGPHPELDAVVGQELAWRKVRAVDPKRDSFFARLRRRLGRR